MTDKSSQRQKRSGIASFADDDQVPLPTPNQIAAAKSAGEGLGFRSEKPPVVESAPAKSRRREPTFTDAIHIRSRPADRQRFEDFAWRHRLSKGDAITRLLDYAEVEERRLEQEKPSGQP